MSGHCGRKLEPSRNDSKHNDPKDPQSVHLETGTQDASSELIN